ncbi:MAG: nucleotidyltransferase domain-containing protein [Desulfobacterales bacterium]|nr:MAG: nucleotidyltransferase domain-containing protein [Desulfobacterales bacterium]
MIEEKITAYFRNQKEVVSVYLYGSYASGQNRAFSDIDLGVLFAGGDKDTIDARLSQYLGDLTEVLRKDIHLTCMNYASEGLLKQIFKKGRCILVADQKRLTYFKMVAFSRIADFGFYLKQMQAGLICRVKEG